MNTSPHDPLHMSFPVNTLQPGPADIDARRSISDSVLSRGQVMNYNNKNTMYLMITRSGGSTVKQIVERIIEQCDAAENETSCSPPEAECCVLAQWAVDAYYRVVIAGKGGIPAIVRAMTVFASSRGLQEAGCLALGNLCMQRGGNLVALEKAGGISCIVSAMRNHSTSVAVQSAACDALRNMSHLILAQATSPSSSCCPELVTILANAKEMYLLPSHKLIAENLMSAIVSQTVKQHTL
jgi:hypothetical protein